MISDRLQKKFTQACRDGNKEVYDEMINLGYLDSGQISLEETSEYEINGNKVRAASPLYCAAASGNLDIIKDLLKRGSGVEGHEKDSESPLSIAAATGHLDVVEELLERGANVNASNKNKLTPLHFAADGDFLDIAKLLLRGGADIGAQSAGGSSPTDIAQRTTGGAVVNLLDKVTGLRGKIMRSGNRDAMKNVFNTAEEGLTLMAISCLNDGKSLGEESVQTSLRTGDMNIDTDLFDAMHRIFTKELDRHEKAGTNPGTSITRAISEMSNNKREPNRSISTPQATQLKNVGRENEVLSGMPR